MARSACELADHGDLDALRQLPPSALREADKNGHTAAHWAAGSGHLDALIWLIASGLEADGIGKVSSRSKRRRPLHFAARNGQLRVVRYLCEDAGADPDSRDSQSVSPFQLAIWQNQLEVARYLVEQREVDPTQRNVFACGAQHWLGTTPAERSGQGGAALLPTARWLQGHGVDWHAPQRQGHSPLHKASWGGHLALCRWLRDECGALDVRIPPTGPDQPRARADSGAGRASPDLCRCALHRTRPTWAATTQRTWPRWEGMPSSPRGWCPPAHFYPREDSRIDGTRSSAPSLSPRRLL